MIFGKDRATGSLAESAADAMENINLETKQVQRVKNLPCLYPLLMPLPHPPFLKMEKQHRIREKSMPLTMFIKMIEKGLHSVSEEMSKLVSVVGNPGLGNMPNELKDMGFDSDQCVAISMYFADNPSLE